MWRMALMRVLVVEVDTATASTLVRVLRRHGVEAARSVDPLNAIKGRVRPDVVLLDLGTRIADGVATCRIIRSVSSVPIVVITEHAASAQRIHALHAGVDDYLIKPYDLDELIARIEVAHRRSRPGQQLRVRIEHGDLTVDLVRQTVRVDERQIELPRKEFQILALIAAANGGVCMRDRLIDEIWGGRWPGANATLSVHLNSLRARLGRPGLIETVRGLGYRLSSAAATMPSPYGNPPIRLARLAD
jgi:DNA-binding response OmpR family regulator